MQGAKITVASEVRAALQCRIMIHNIRNAEDLTWLLNHTQRFQGGHVMDLHIQKRRLFDEGTGRQVTAGTQISAVIRYDISPIGLEGNYGVTRVAKLNLMGVTDFSIFEQEGSDFSEIGIIHAEARSGRLRFWFDPQGELYVICEEAFLEEVSMPNEASWSEPGMTHWTFQAHSDDLPEIEWFLQHLDQMGVPCAWRPIKRTINRHPAIRWEGHFLSVVLPEEGDGRLVHIQTYGSLDGAGFGVTLRTCHSHKQDAARLLRVLAELLSMNFKGTCLIGRGCIEQNECYRPVAVPAWKWWEASHGCGDGFIQR